MILIGSTMAAFVTDRDETCLSWLANAEALRDSVDDEVRFFAAFETDARGMDPFMRVYGRLDELGGDWWTFELDDERESVSTQNRLSHICTGRNLITDYACGTGASHILFLDADMAPDPQTLPKLLEMNHPLVGGQVPTYDLRGPVVPNYPYPVQEHWNTAGYLLVARQVFRFVRWRWDMDVSMTDDPCYAWDALHYLNVPTYVRKDCVGTHHPESIPAIEQRGHDMTVVRRR